MKPILLLLFGLLVAVPAFGQAQCAGITVLPSQDCRGAIPICGLLYKSPTNTVCGPGVIAHEVPQGSCLETNELNSTWFTFQVQSAGLLKFVIIPNDQTIWDTTDGVDSTIHWGTSDYDWALYRLPLNTKQSEASCRQIRDSLSWEVSCNYVGGTGFSTGMMDTTDIYNNPRYTRYNLPLRVQSGESYILIVNNYDVHNAQLGYSIRFKSPNDVRSSTDSVYGIADIRLAPFALGFDRIDTLSSALDLTLDRLFDCSRMTSHTVRLIDPLNTSQLYQVNFFGSNQTCYSGYSDRFLLSYSPFDPAIVNRLQLIIQDTIIDYCGHVSVHDTLPLLARTLVSTKTKANGIAFSIYPQPNSGQFSVDLRSLPLQECRLEVMEGITGRRVWSSCAQGGMVNEVNPKATLPPGLYMVEVRQGSKRFVQKMVVAR